MKKRVGILNGTPIVEGDPNLLSNKELLHKGGGSLAKRNIDGKVEDLGGGSGSGNSSHYYKVLLPSDDLNAEMICLLLLYTPILGISIPEVGNMSIIVRGTSSDQEIVTAHEIFKAQAAQTGGANCALKISNDSYSLLGLTLESLIIPEGDLFSKSEAICRLLGVEEANIPIMIHTMKGFITPITEEEYLNFNGE